MMLVRHLPTTKGDHIASSGWEVAFLYEDDVTFGPMFGLYEDRDKMLREYKVVADAD